MPRISEKVQNLMSANIQKIIDRAQETKSLKVIDEYIRQVERYLEALEDSAATVGGSVRRLKGKYEEYKKQADEVEPDIESMILRGKDELHITSDPHTLDTKVELAQEFYEQWQEQAEQYENLLVMYVKLEERLYTIKCEREKLKHLENTNKAMLVDRTLGALDGQKLIESVYAQKQRKDAHDKTIHPSIEVTQFDMDKVKSDIAECRKRLLDKD